ncbi:MAG: hypothetical protein HY713_15035 [candidate division NC10 bacterium]|nr:hypothetical protein [candidate division NC10 bacterium]
MGERYARARCLLWRLCVKITSVETFRLRFPVDPYRYGASSKGWIRDRSSLLVRVKTDAGVEGWGEGGQTGPPELTQVVVDHSLAPLLVGEDPFASTILGRAVPGPGGPLRDRHVHQAGPGPGGAVPHPARRGQRIRRSGLLGHEDEDRLLPPKTGHRPGGRHPRGHRSGHSAGGGRQPRVQRLYRRRGRAGDRTVSDCLVRGTRPAGGSPGVPAGQGQGEHPYQRGRGGVHLVRRAGADREEGGGHHPARHLRVRRDHGVLADRGPGPGLRHPVLSPRVGLGGRSGGVAAPAGFLAAVPADGQPVPLLSGAPPGIRSEPQPVAG